MAAKKILVTGSSGVIGTRLCEKLLEAGYSVVGADWKPNKWNGAINSLTVMGDLRDRGAVMRLPADCDTIIHLAANASVYKLIEDPSLALDNLKTTFNMLEFARANKKKIIFASSREVYGDSDEAAHREQDTCMDKCESPYAASKLGAEALIQAYHRCYGLDFAILRFSNVYGMYDWESGRVVPKFIRQCRQGDDLTVFGKEKALDLVHIDDAVKGIILCVEKFNGAKNNAYNIAQGRSTRLLALANKIKGLLKKNVKIIIKKNRAGEVMNCAVDISKARRKLNYSPKIGIDEGLKKAIQWYRANRGSI